ncbi:hypothetical protein Rs2_12421 [Raphanus sativus]|nr:hypothetical protein Rs2_12421 [Raphanus sativus]
MSSVVPGWRFQGNYTEDADNGRIIVAWDPILSLAPRKPRFIYFTMFAMHPNFSNLLNSAWTETTSSGSSMSSLYQKLRSAKVCCKSINRSSFSNIQLRAKEAHQALEQVQMQALTNPSSQLFEEENEVRKSWMFFAAAEESFIYQKSRLMPVSHHSQWIKFAKFTRSDVLLHSHLN